MLAISDGMLGKSDNSIALNKSLQAVTQTIARLEKKLRNKDV
jgi:hypothetical protein